MNLCTKARYILCAIMATLIHPGNKVEARQILQCSDARVIASKHIESVPIGDYVDITLLHGGKSYREKLKKTTNNVLGQDSFVVDFSTGVLLVGGDEWTNCSSI